MFVNWVEVLRHLKSHIVWRIVAIKTTFESLIWCLRRRFCWQNASYWNYVCFQFKSSLDVLQFYINICNRRYIKIQEMYQCFPKKESSWRGFLNYILFNYGIPYIFWLEQKLPLMTQKFIHILWKLIIRYNLCLLLLLRSNSS